MNKKRKHIILLIPLCALMLLFAPAAGYANSAEPPSLVILINDPPADLSIVMKSLDKETEAIVRRTAWEGYYVFYSRDMQSDDEYTFEITADGERFSCTFDAPLNRYNNVATLDLMRQELIPGTYPFRSVLLVSIRLLLTLFIEGIIFWLFGFRQKSSWLTFLAINLATQGVLNIWLSSGSSLMPSYLIFSLLIGEVLVFIAELIAFPVFLKEHTTFRIVACVFLANVISLIAGSYFITNLPV